eukprot:CAMPEP_0183293960 /NCGR_PEP_ID=MMETSP0160_2-20130417/2469_1 /TAXON_ID=2839 ORGANISM="Odontella Sinensis, Strain Grunow 1884" /NCGR_SAMPLE_ID=MMETSP0160_2 /ASSEMBLY_ACC=CAM_ASM_000250 /LENGTH=67 /DNA_ID=CAMNT_0025455179 /DNA_START=375 /DNA_END=578 /DNA_ORIENTATION=+
MGQALPLMRVVMRVVVPPRSGGLDPTQWLAESHNTTRAAGGRKSKGVLGREHFNKDRSEPSLGDDFE